MLGFLAISGEPGVLDELRELRSVELPSETLILDKALYAAILKEAAVGFGVEESPRSK